jgi:hypothetical protein
LDEKIRDSILWRASMQKLPIGIQHFTTLREEGYLYVDKTEQIHTLMRTGKFLFLSRPRRFGKSLLITTLREIYRGNQALFQGLWIEDKIDWQPRPIILINFNDINYRDMSLSDALSGYMDKLAREHDLVLEATDHKGKFLELIVRLSEQQKVALLVDEYDKAITDLLEDEQKVAEHVATLKNFYSVLKATEADHIHFALLTGVSKYGKISIFSDLNNLLDVTMDARFATLLGYTQAELEHYFPDYIDRLATKYNASRSETLEQIKFWYNGYSWDGINRVYVPFSTLVFLEQQRFINHWFATATPSFLIKLLRRNQVPAYTLDDLTTDNKLLESADVNSMSAVSLLFQTGYLTIKQVHESFLGEEYDLGYPNHEVAQSFQQYLLADYLDATPDRISATILSNLHKTLRTQNIEGFIAILKSVFGGIPHNLFLPQEAYYHSVVYLILNLLGFTIHAERLTNLGRMDAVLELADVAYIIEFKMTTSETAIQQIRDKQYDLPFRNRGKLILLLGIAFDKENHNIADWAVERIESKA